MFYLHYDEVDGSILGVDYLFLENSRVETIEQLRLNLAQNYSDCAIFDFSYGDRNKKYTVVVGPDESTTRKGSRAMAQRRR